MSPRVYPSRPRSASPQHSGVLVPEGSHLNPSPGIPLSQRELPPSRCHLASKGCPVPGYKAFTLLPQSRQVPALEFSVGIGGACVASASQSNFCPCSILVPPRKPVAPQISFLVSKLHILKTISLNWLASRLFISRPLLSFPASSFIFPTHP